ncbi:MAG TPA: efflux RND transporter periplasmic adaptor subunit [Steroidobacteraceae bacterium]|nr:efflux RND transporter periplasmic adaptor subunit [Steroidobacteraceae bacterium]
MTVGKRSLTAGLILVAVVAIVALAWWRHGAQGAGGSGGRRGNTGPVTVTVAQATKGDIGVYLDAIGTVTPVYTAAITSQVNGLIVAVRYKEAQRVRKGDPLVDIDPRPYQATLLQAQGTLERDQNLLAQQEMDLKRYRDALARNAIAEQTVDDQQKLVLQTRGTVKNDRGVVDYDQVQLDYCHITSPITGEVGLRLVDPGNVVQAGGSTTLAVVTQLEPITVVFTLPEDNLGAVRARLRSQATLTVEALDRTGENRLATGVLTALDNQIDTTTGTVKARATFDNKDDALFPNQFVTTRLLVNTLHGVTLVPASAIQQNGTSSFVYVIEDKEAHMQAVKVGVTDGNLTQVQGLTPGQVVANSSFEKLQDKAAVVPATAAGAGAVGAGSAPGGGGADAPAADPSN